MCSCGQAWGARRSDEVCGGAGMIYTSKQLKDKVRNISHGDNEIAEDESSEKLVTVLHLT